MPNPRHFKYLVVTNECHPSWHLLIFIGAHIHVFVLSDAIPDEA
jgi:predicted membrane channel-forming protein YqfA (hemolysin III family)